MQTFSLHRIFQLHPIMQGFTGYVEHLRFAAGVAGRLTLSALSFLVHALFPLCPIKKCYDFEATMAYLSERNDYVESKT